MKPRTLVCIPTYNNSGSIAEVLKDVLAATEAPVLILDDGSTTPVESLIHPDPRVSIFRFGENRGKGSAIRKCFEIGIARGFTHIITIDGDGQHKAYDLPLIEEKIKTSPWDLIIGKRKFSGEHVPKSSQFGRKFSNFWVKYQTHMTIEDSQSGFRAYPLYYVQHMNFFTTRYDFEIEVLIRLIWKKVSVSEVAIDVYYPPPELRISHFDKFKDNVKISVLNTVLVVLSLLHSNLSRSRIILSASLGVFTGILPIFGLQIYIAAFLAFVFRLNFPLMFLFQQISLPPLIPVWTYLSLLIGSRLFGETLVITPENALAEARRLIPVWITGSIVLGLVLALITAIILFIVTEKKKYQKQWTGKDRGGKFGNWFMNTTMRELGPGVAYFFLLFICPYFFLFAPKAVASHNQYFRISQPSKSFCRRQWDVLKTFFRLGQVLLDNSYAAGKGKDYYRIVRNGQENLFQPSQKNGLILVGAHVGGWMFASKIFEDDEVDGKKLKVNIVEFQVGGGQNASNKISSQNIHYINNEGPSPIFEISSALSQNEIVVFMADRMANAHVELIPFFGKLAPIDVAPFKIALAKKAPVAFCFAFKTSGNEYNLYITPHVDPAQFSGLSKEDALIALSGKYTESLEHFLKLYPHQWFNFFPFWSSV